jgi:transposase InsO family protein
MPKTTDSRHCLPVFHNVVKGMALASANQVWVGDITSIRTDEGFRYLSLLIDLWSRKLVGYHAGDTLEAKGALLSLEMALRELPKAACPVHTRTEAVSIARIGMLRSSKLLGFR